MPEDVLEDYNEAREVFDKSPKASAALLRLALQKLCKHLGGKGEKINEDIQTLVKNGLDLRVQQALDTVRVVGNNAVHPGEIDINDNKEVASSLFGLLNFIVDEMITKPMQIDALYNSLPEGSICAIEKRDKKYGGEI